MSATLSLRLFTGDDGPALHSASPPQSRPQLYTLREAFEAVLRPTLELKGRALGTLAGYETTLRAWERLTENPPISAITDDDLAAFHRAFPDETHGPRARNKHTINVEAILRICGPRDSRNKRGRGILEVVPFCERAAVGAPRKRRRVIAPEQFDLIYDGCSIARWPQHPTLPAPLVWRCLFLLLWTYGPRRSNAFRMPAEAVIRSAPHPEPELDVANPLGWLSYVPTKTAGTKPEPLTLPLNSTLRAHLDRLGPRRNLLFPFSTCTRDWRAWSHKIQAAVGIDEPFAFQDFRKTCNVNWNRLGGRKALGRYVLGHLPRDVNTQFYEDFTADVAELVHSFPYPSLVASGRCI